MDDVIVIKGIAANTIFVTSICAAAIVASSRHRNVIVVLFPATAAAFRAFLIVRNGIALLLAAAMATWTETVKICRTYGTVLPIVVVCRTVAMVRSTSQRTQAMGSSARLTA